MLIVTSPPVSGELPRTMNSANEPAGIEIVVLILLVPLAGHVAPPVVAQVQLGETNNVGNALLLCRYRLLNWNPHHPKRLQTYRRGFPLNLLLL